MAHTPSPEGNSDPAGNTQMFRAFVDEGRPQPGADPAASRGSRLGLVLGVLALIVIVAVVTWLALS
jgi:hypothetical protein